MLLLAPGQGKGGIWEASSVSWRRQWQPHSSTLAWKIPWTEEPGRLQSMGSQSVRHDWATSLSLCTFMHWRRKWQPTPVFCPENPRDSPQEYLRSLVGCRLCSRRVRHNWSDLAAAAAAAASVSGDDRRRSLSSDLWSQLTGYYPRSIPHHPYFISYIKIAQDVLSN